MKRVKIHWLAQIEGGRVAPPSGPRYSTVCRFAEDLAAWPEVAWSLVLEELTPPGSDGTAFADVRFLSPEAPLDLLHPGAVFELYEGRHCVARGEVLPE
jgi:hypothetical protein